MALAEAAPAATAVAKAEAEAGAPLVATDAKKTAAPHLHSMKDASNFRLQLHVPVKMLQLQNPALRRCAEPAIHLQAVAPVVVAHGRLEAVTAAARTSGRVLPLTIAVLLHSHTQRSNNRSCPHRGPCHRRNSNTAAQAVKYGAAKKESAQISSRQSGTSIGMWTSQKFCSGRCPNMAGHHRFCLSVGSSGEISHRNGSTNMWPQRMNPSLLRTAWRIGRPCRTGASMHLRRGFDMSHSR